MPTEVVNAGSLRRELSLAVSRRPSVRGRERKEVQGQGGGAEHAAMAEQKMSCGLVAFGEGWMVGAAARRESARGCQRHVMIFLCTQGGRRAHARNATELTGKDSCARVMSLGGVSVRIDAVGQETRAWRARRRSFGEEGCEVTALMPLTRVKAEGHIQRHTSQSMQLRGAGKREHAVGGWFLS